jgi:hypothetical protein
MFFTKKEKEVDLYEETQKQAEAQSDHEHDANLNELRVLTLEAKDEGE